MKGDKLLVASNNKGKITEIRHILLGMFDEIVSFSELGLTLETQEDGDTFLENAVKKAEEAAAASGMAALADDSGICVDALDGGPGVYSARYSQKGDAENNKKLLRVLENVPDEQRGASFVCCVALARPGRPTIHAHGRLRGRVRREPAGDKGFGYDCLFEPEGFCQTFGELPEDLKNSVSHRRAALGNLLDLLRQEKTP